MYPILILREELVCFVILLFLRYTAGTYHMGRDGRNFYRLLLFAGIHVLFDIITVITVNNLDRIPAAANYVCHVIFYMAAILYSREICIYVFRMSYPERVKSFSVATIIPPVIYLLSLPVLPIDYKVCHGTNSSTGSAAIVGYSIAFLYFITGIVIILTNRNKLRRSVRNALLPMMLILVVAEVAQVIIPELLFTGGAVTVVTVGFFFSLENPVHVFEQKVNTDALTGLKSRHSYENEIAAMDKEFKSEPSDNYIFAYCDINNLRGVNGSYGHQEGDRYITFITRGLSSRLKHAVSIYRLGGDEFLAVYHNFPEEKAAEELNRLQEYCRKNEEGMPYEPGVAIGYAVSGKDYKSLRDVIRTADYIMYKNKSEMRTNQTFINSAGGTKLNLSGLTDRVFSAMCGSDRKSYPFITNLETNVTRVAPGWKEFFGLPDEYMADFMEIWAEKLHPHDRDGFLDQMMTVLNGNERYYEAEFRALSAGGDYVKCTCNGSIYHGQRGEPDIFTGYMVNYGVPETVDAITGLPNFLAMDEVVQNTIDSGGAATIIKLEINQFSRINMLYGYLGGDTILKRMAELIQQVIGQKGLLFCQDGVHFSLFLPDSSKEYAEHLYNSLFNLFAAGISVENKTVPLNISGGATTIERNIPTDRPTIRRKLIYALDESIYSRHSKLVFYETPASEETSDGLGLLAAVHHDAVTDMKYFELRYQKIVCCDTEKTVGAEALLRWIHPDYGTVMPGRFIGFLENDPGYYNLGLRIIREALIDCARFREASPGFTINVNITALQLRNESFIPSVSKLIRESGLPAECLIFELTERCKELDTEFLKTRIREIQEAGIRVALDDMGTGYSTVDLLLNVPADEIKLDYAFTKELTKNTDYRVFAEAVMKGRKNRGYVICFEGVETEEQQKLIQTYGNSLCQGYLFSRPVRSEELLTEIEAAQ